DRERATEDRHRISRSRKKSDRLLLLNQKSSADQHCDQEQLHNRPDILERASAPKIAKVEKGNDPNENEGENHRRTKIKNALKIFSEGHGGESDGRGETDGCRNKAGHEAKGG